MIGGGGALAAGWFAYQTIRSQREQIGEQQTFIAEQTRFMDDQRQNLELERAELRAVAEDRRWEQARKIKVESDETTGGNGASYWRVLVMNRAEAPLHTVDVRFGPHMPERVREWREDGRRGEEWLVPVHIIGAGRAALFFSEDFSETGVGSLCRPLVFFTDDNGARWSLDWYGKLEEVPADGAS
ncbi:hypothetical protein ACQPXT_01095 (plasmid) [Streptomyces sp. CA-100214]